VRRQAPERQVGALPWRDAQDYDAPVRLARVDPGGGIGEAAPVNRPHALKRSGGVGEGSEILPDRKPAASYLDDRRIVQPGIHERHGLEVGAAVAGGLESEASKLSGDIVRRLDVSEGSGLPAKHRVRREDREPLPKVLR
jgi:hypothetical protein